MGSNIFHLFIFSLKRDYFFGENSFFRMLDTFANHTSSSHSVILLSVIQAARTNMVLLPRGVTLLMF